MLPQLFQLPLRWGYFWPISQRTSALPVLITVLILTLGGRKLPNPSRKININKHETDEHLHSVRMDGNLEPKWAVNWCIIRASATSAGRWVNKVVVLTEAWQRTGYPLAQCLLQPCWPCMYPPIAVKCSGFFWSEFWGYKETVTLSEWFPRNKFQCKTISD